MEQDQATTATAETGEVQPFVATQEPVSEEQPTQSAISATDVEKIVSERVSRALDAHRDELRRIAQSDQDKLLNRLQKRLGAKFQAYEDIGKEEGWDAEKIAEKRNAALQQALSDEVSQPSAPTPAAPPDTVEESELRKYLLNNYGEVPSGLDLGQWAGKPRADASWQHRFTKAAAKAVAKAEEEAEKQVKAQGVAKAAAQSGTTTTISAGTPANTTALEKELVELNEGRPTLVSRRRADEIRSQLRKMGKWEVET